MNEVHIGSEPLTLETVLDVAYGRSRVAMSSQALEKVKSASGFVQSMADKDAKGYYGINTGFGSFKDVRISAEKLAVLQTNIVRSHSVGVGERLDIPTTRAMMLLRLQTLALGHSGVRPLIVETLCKMLNADLVPMVPSQGSVGASGDLSPLAHLALGLIGEGDCHFRGRKMPSAAAFQEAGLKPVSLGPKEGLSLINGTQMMCAIGMLNIARAENVLVNVDIAAAMTLDVTMGSWRAYDDRIIRLRPHPGQKTSASNLLKITSESEIWQSHSNCDRVQDAYSIRCAPQVHGAARDNVAYVKEVLLREINSVTDNPVIYAEEKAVLSGGNFHGQPVALALDSLAMGLGGVGSISERRIFRMLDPDLSELPAGLVQDGGLNTGLLMFQVLAASLVNECKTYAHPASVDSIPTWSDQEDHVSMGAFAARKAEKVIDALEKIVSIELMCGAQALEFRRPMKAGKGIEAAYAEIRTIVASLDGDRYMAPELERVVGIVKEGKVRAAVEKEVGHLD